MQSKKVGVPLEEGRVLGTKVFSVGCSDDGDGVAVAGQWQSG